jgi:endonuclease/exonuclease/phosphatase family metal-dependent hydrolase
MGDFNDPPESACMQHVTGASLCNLFPNDKPSATEGSQKYRSKWSRLDQILVHSRMTVSEPEATLQVVKGSACTFSPSFLFIDDKKWKGKRPLRSYYGFKYEAGYSDHLPVVADFIVLPPK